MSDLPALSSFTGAKISANPIVCHAHQQRQRLPSGQGRLCFPALSLEVQKQAFSAVCQQRRLQITHYEHGCIG